MIKWFSINNMEFEAGDNVGVIVNGIYYSAILDSDDNRIFLLASGDFISALALHSDASHRSSDCERSK